MPIPNSSWSITMRVHLGADPLGIGRITTAVGEAGGTVVGVDIVESHPDLLVVDLTCNAADARHAEAITAAVEAVPGRPRPQGERPQPVVSTLHRRPRLTRQSGPSEQPPASGGRRVEGTPGRRPTSVPHRCAGSVRSGRWADWHITPTSVHHVADAVDRIEAMHPDWAEPGSGLTSCMPCHPRRSTAPSPTLPGTTSPLAGGGMRRGVVGRREVT
jgi:hypothetical protein